MKDNKDAIVIFLIIFVVVGLAWEPIKKNGLGSVISSTSTPSDISSSSSPTSSTYTPGAYTPPTYPPPSTYNPNDPYTLPKTTTPATQKTNLSPYYGKVMMSYVNNLNNTDPSEEYITLSTNLTENESVDISGWKLVSSKTGNWIRLGGAALLPLPNTRTALSDIVLRQNDTAFLVKGFSPVGISFRSNECTGYFEENRTFYPYLNMSCPLAKKEDLPQFSSLLDYDDECRNIISTIPACRTPANYMNLNKLPDTVIQSCRDYLSTQINYNTCVAKHFTDKNFAGHEWYVYMNIFGPLWRTNREDITLYDRNGLEVANVNWNY